MTPKISIVMPALNVCKYIESCIASVQNQSFKDIEMIIVDAGSTDGTLEIIKNKVDEDNRIKVIHSEQKSYGYQVNLGIQEAMGDYIAIVETDDMVTQNGYEQLYLAARKTNADYVKGGAECFWEDENNIYYGVNAGLLNETMNQCFFNKTVTIWPKEMPVIILRDIYLWNGIYKSTFVKKIKLNETKGAAYQDHGFSIDVLSKAEKGVYISDIVYRYRLDNMNSSVKSTNGLRYLYGEFELNYPKVQKLDNDWKNSFFQRVLDMLIERFRGMARQNLFWEDSKDVMEQFQAVYQNAIKNGDLIDEELSSERRYELELFLKDPFLLYQKKCNDIKERRRIVTEMKDKIADQDVVIFGAGKVGKFLAVRISSIDHKKLVAYCDNATELQGETCQGVSVLSPKDAVCLYPNAVYIIAGKRDEKEMKEKLQENGVMPDRVYTYTGGLDTEILKIYI